MKKYIVFILLLQACNNSINNKTKLDLSDKEGYNINMESKIVIYELSPEAKNITQQWSSLQELQNIIANLVKGDYSTFKEKDNYLKESIGELRKTLPEKLNINSITSRLLVLETNILQLESVLSESGLESKNKVVISNKSIESYYNFIYQINKIIEKELQIIE
ncbi:MAG: small-conductance mechanosensitive channel [Flavobacteriaceae bacterium]|jgi:small-conductance mechanosensitive channel|tara:strand:- start:5755 stop:6243 length:489 start_codon:yes stop_codon:yes gene_type:complete